MRELAKQVYSHLQALVDGDMAELPVGLRAHYSDEKVKVGKKLARSFVWVDNVKTSKKLNGTCCIGLAHSVEDIIDCTPDEEALDKIEAALKKIKQYGDNNKISLIIGDSYSKGNDAWNNEFVISNARVVAIFN